MASFWPRRRCGPTVEGSKTSAEDKHRLYAAQVAKAVGVKRFEQFVFLQHFVLTFDESRHLLFWDPARSSKPFTLRLARTPKSPRQPSAYAARWRGAHHRESRAAAAVKGRAGAAAFRELARRRLSTFWEHYTPVDHRTPEERRRENEDFGSCRAC